MGREPIKRTLGDLDFRITPFGGRKSWDLFGEVTRAAGPALAEGMAAFKVSDLLDLDTESAEGLTKLLDDLRLDKLSGAIRTLYERIDRDTWWRLTMELLAGVEVRKDDRLARAMGGDAAGERGWLKLNEDIFDMIFTANLGPVFHLLGIVAEVNWKGPLASYLGSSASPKTAEA